jgi:hypothetical protein
MKRNNKLILKLIARNVARIYSKRELEPQNLAESADSLIFS